MNPLDKGQSDPKWQAARSIVSHLLEHGFQAYFVGGYVRDRLLQRPISDIDIATSAKPEQVLSLFPHTVATGLQHGTVSVIIDKIPYEVTTFRVEAEYTASRRPTGVTFIEDLSGDLLRRDFTVNAMAMDVDGQLIDPFGGQRDLERRMLRAVGKASDRFDEDALRMLRCLRFAANLDFTIESETWQALLIMREHLTLISMERVRMELDKMIEGPHPDRAVQLLLDSELYQHMKSARPLTEAFSMIRESGREWRRLLLPLASPIARWSALFLQLQIDPETAQLICRELTHANKKTEQIVKVMRFYRQLMDSQWIEPQTQSDPETVWKLAVLQFGRESADVILDLLFAFDDQRAIPFVTQGSAWTAAMPVYQLRELTINGHDVMTACGRKHGVWLKRVLSVLLHAVALGELPNERNVLLMTALQLAEKEE